MITEMTRPQSSTIFTFDPNELQEVKIDVATSRQGYMVVGSSARPKKCCKITTIDCCKLSIATICLIVGLIVTISPFLSISPYEPVDPNKKMYKDQIIYFHGALIGGLLFTVYVAGNCWRICRRISSEN